MAFQVKEVSTFVLCSHRRWQLHCYHSGHISDLVGAFAVSFVLMQALREKRNKRSGGKQKVSFFFFNKTLFRGFFEAVPGWLATGTRETIWWTHLQGPFCMAANAVTCTTVAR